MNEDDELGGPELFVLIAIALFAIVVMTVWGY